MTGTGGGRGEAHVGCCGWSYPDWRGALYPPGTKPAEWFSYYAKHFATVEVNNTFYRLPKTETFSAWEAQAPRGFVYALKVSQFGTHRLKLREPERWLPGFLERSALLGRARGPHLVQLPPRWRRDAGRLRDFLEVATHANPAPGPGPDDPRPGSPPGAGPRGNPAPVRWAVELRDPSWLHEDTYDVLRRYQAALCWHDLLADHPWLLTTNWGYCRFHGPRAATEKYVGDYGPEALGPAVTALRGWQDLGHDVYAYFNNDTGGAAVRDATYLVDQLASH